MSFLTKRFVPSRRMLRSICCKLPNAMPTAHAIQQLPLPRPTQTYSRHIYIMECLHSHPSCIVILNRALLWPYKWFMYTIYIYIGNKLLSLWDLELECYYFCIYNNPINMSSSYSRVGRNKSIWYWIVVASIQHTAEERKPWECVLYVKEKSSIIDSGKKELHTKKG